MRTVFAILAILPGLCRPAAAEQHSAARQRSDGFAVVTVVRNLDHPWSVAFLPDSGFLVTERGGRMLLFRNDGVARTVSGLPKITAAAQGGLLDVIADPDFKTNRTIYFSYSGSGPGGVGTQTASAVLDGATLKNLKVIFTARPKTEKNLHFGSRLLAITGDKLLVTLGDKAQSPILPGGRVHEAQKPSSHLGAIVRINRDGSIPKDNPFVGRKGYLPEIYTYGNRNVQGIALDPATGTIWFHEHGPRGGDELNMLKAGANYGWPTVTYGIDYSGAVISDRQTATGIAPPVIHWTPSIAPSGMTVYTGNAFPEWRGNIFIGSLVQRHLRRVILQGNRVVGQETLLKGLGERIRDVRTGPDGFIYILTDSPNGRLLRLEPR